MTDLANDLVHSCSYPSAYGKCIWKGSQIPALLGVAQAAEDNWDFSLEGYYRVRSHSFHNLYLEQTEPGRYVTHRLRLQPQLNFENRAKFIMMTDVIDDAVWGDNQSIASTALFADDPSLTSVEGTSIDQFRIKRAWFETNLAIGVLRVGRQESHWVETSPPTLGGTPPKRRWLWSSVALSGGPGPM